MFLVTQKVANVRTAKFEIFSEKFDAAEFKIISVYISTYILIVAVNSFADNRTLFQFSIVK